MVHRRRGVDGRIWSCAESMAGVVDLLMWFGGR